MSQLSFLTPPVWSVAEVTLYLRELLENDIYLQDIWINGEVSNFSRPSSGHIYFTLRDNVATLRCVMWKNLADRLIAFPRDGEAVEVHGTISIYEAAGQYQLYADTIRPVGEGALYLEFLRLKAQLEVEGLFTPERKRSIPAFPELIGIVSSPTGAAIKDILNTISRRYPIARVVISPSPVQGDEAPEGIVTALNTLNKIVNPDVIILARGGGSLEDLWAFNDERVVRAIVASQAPVITGVGHETDFSLADFASDLRAPTPTAAAELATPNRSDLVISINDQVRRLGLIMNSKVETNRYRLKQIESLIKIRSPMAIVRTGRQRLDDLARKAEIIIKNRFQIQRMRLTALEQQINSLNPQEILKRGYAVLSLPDQQIVRSITQINSGDNLLVRVQDGNFGVQVTEPGHNEK